MTTPYAGNPATSPVDEIRFLIQDVDSTDVLLTDAEIQYMIGRIDPVYGDTAMTAAYCADIIAGRFAREASISADGASIAMEQLQGEYEQLGKDLRAMYNATAGAGGVPIVGGVDAFSVWDATIRPPSFGIGMQDNARAGQQDYGTYLMPNIPSSGYWTGGW